MCVTNSVTSSLYLDMNEKLPQLTIEEEKELAKFIRLGILKILRIWKKCLSRIGKMLNMPAKDILNFVKKRKNRITMYLSEKSGNFAL